MAQTKVIILAYILFTMSSHIIQSIEGRFMKFEYINDVLGPHSHIMASEREIGRVKNYVAQSPPPGRVDGFRPVGRGHSPGIGHSIQN
ncbi:hypothetical protein RND71_012222 [Anisodus tanguticus]|uniref:Uncharacterized protein n=1 Tax=Anisodus tanguticus TaxID=243964 RepID=A0AAE1SE72_9SOLA|nr:hypothetical protein RND71_012222 [Anisodus tanguticus]